ncbi:MAG TPA: ferritin-like protein [Herpetosiphonaceae bacterium]
MIRIKPELFRVLEAGNKDVVKLALQQAIELEHSTIPPYLYALYSLIPGKNDSIAEIIESVVVEEMLHMTLVSNILNALGGSPQIDLPDFIPNYPGPLPGSVESQLVVGLAPFSIDLVHDVFMTIEEPENPIQFPVLLEATEPLTIGQFYREIQQKIIGLGDDAFSKKPRNQIGPEIMDESIVVTNVATACQAIDMIVEQGEGTSTSPLEEVGGGYAHYYRYAEIYHGKQLIPNPEAGPDTPTDQQYLYGGAPVPFDQTGVYAAPTNPKAATYPEGSASRIACDTFNYTYTSLLKVLHAMFNGQSELFNTALGLMMSLKQQAKDMMAGTNTGGTSTGPSFEYQPLNP